MGFYDLSESQLRDALVRQRNFKSRPEYENNVEGRIRELYLQACLLLKRLGVKKNNSSLLISAEENYDEGLSMVFIPEKRDKGLCKMLEGANELQQLLILNFTKGDLE